MAMHEGVRAISKIAGSALTIYRFISHAADGEYDHTGAAAEISGIAGESVAANKVFGMITPSPGSEAKVEAGAAITRGAQVQSDATGRAVTAVSGVGNGKGGVALTAAAAAGDIITIDFAVSVDEVA